MKRIMFLILSIILFIISIFIALNYSGIRIYSNFIINEKKAKKITNEKQKTDEIITLYCNGIEIPYDKENDFYLLSQDNSEFYTDKIYSKEYSLLIIKPNQNKSAIIENNEDIAIMAYNTKYYKRIKLKLTTLSSISITTTREYENERKDATLNVYDITKGELKISSYNSIYHARGASSRYQDKNPFKLNILDEKGNSKKVSLLSMRKDNDWILNSIYLDQSFMREKIGFDLWNNLSEDYNTHMEYVELFVDNKYKGIYYLEEPVDNKTFDLSKKDMLISVKSWETDENSRALYSSNSNIMIDEFEITKPLKTDEKSTELVRKFYDTVGKDIYHDTLLIDKENFANYEILINMITSIDNTWKNEKIAFIKKGNIYIIKKTPWDLDWSMYNENAINYFILPANEYYLEDHAISKSVKESKEFQNAIKNNYKKSKSFFNEDYMNRLIDKYYNKLNNSGAVKRNNTVWENKDFDESVQYIRDYFKERIKFLDEYYEV